LRDSQLIKRIVEYGTQVGASGQAVCQWRTGGIGKTRLALEIAADNDAVRFVDLSPISDGELIGAAVAEAVGIRKLPSVDTFLRTGGSSLEDLKIVTMPFPDMLPGHVEWEDRVDQFRWDAAGSRHWCRDVRPWLCD
jgi:hypothetical protein